MLELAILGLLKEQELHGYQLKKRLADTLGAGSGVSFGSLYPALARLQAAGAVRVVEGSPAWEAGVRSGDTVLKFDGKVVSMGGKGSCLEGAPGTKLVLTLKRGSRTFDTTVTLRQILPPAPL